MKKILFASLIMLVGSSVYAADACNAGTRTAVPGAVTNFVRVGFNPVCSANSVVVYTDSAADQKLYGGASSVKGASYFGASTLGGAVQRINYCTNNSCGGTEAADKAAAAMTAASAYGT